MAAKKTAKKSVAKATKSSAAKKVVKKPAAKKATAKKAPAHKAAPARHIAVGDKPYTKSQFIATIAEQTGIARKDVTNVLGVVSNIIAAHLNKSGPAVFSWPGIFKMKVVKKPATKARKGINPFTGEPTTFKAKPASRKVKILPLKQLKEMAS